MLMTTRISIGREEQGGGENETRGDGGTAPRGIHMRLDARARPSERTCPKLDRQ